MATFHQVDDEVLALANELIEAHHEHLLNKNIGILFRTEAASSGDKTVLGQASKVSDKINALFSIEERLDFLIWLAEDWWTDATDKQRRWLLDHELCHCGRDGKLRSHDVEEFIEIVERHGLLEMSMRSLVRAAQQHTIPGLVEQLQRTGAVVTPPPAVFN